MTEWLFGAFAVFVFTTVSLGYVWTVHRAGGGRL